MDSSSRKACDSKICWDSQMNPPVTNEAFDEVCARLKREEDEAADPDIVTQKDINDIYSHLVAVTEAILDCSRVISALARANDSLRARVAVLENVTWN